MTKLKEFLPDIAQIIGSEIVANGQKSMKLWQDNI